MISRQQLISRDTESDCASRQAERVGAWHRAKKRRGAVQSALRRAAASWIALLLLASGLQATESDRRLADAAERNDAAAVRRLIADSTSVNATQADNATALHWTVYHDDAELTRRLIEAGAEVRIANHYGMSPLALACRNGNAEIVEMLLDAGADPQSKLPGGETALMTAARTGRLRPVVLLLEHGAEVDAREHREQTALMWAAAEGHEEVVDALLEAGADFRTSLKSGFTPLFFAVREGRTVVVTRLLEAGLDVEAPLKRNRPNPLTLAVENGHFETAVALLQYKADPNAQPAGYAPLHAISWVRKPIRGDGQPPPVGSGNVSSLEIVRNLIAYGADVDLRLARGKSGFADFTTTGATPFVLAARTGDLPLMRLLLELGADPTIPNADGTTALLAAAGVGDLGSGLLSAGTEQEAIAAITLLLELGADVNAVDDNGETAMHAAAYQNWPALIAFLHERSADVDIWNRKNKWGWTPLRIAQGYRKGNFRPDPATIAALEQALKASLAK